MGSRCRRPGHDYRLDDPNAWAAVAAPDGWTATDTNALIEFTVAERAAVTAE